MRLEVKTTPGELPAFWDRNVLFFSNIHSIFYDNVEESKQLIQEISGATTYGGRVLSILDLLFRGRPNLILLEARPNQPLMEYHAGVLGLSLPDFEILGRGEYAGLASSLSQAAPAGTHRSYGCLRSHPAAWVDGFVTDANLVKIAAALGKRTITTLEGSRYGNNKYLLYQHQVEQALPVFDTLLAANRGDVARCLKELRRMGYAKAVVKAQIGASGYGMIKLETESDPTQAVPDYLFFEGVCLVQGWIDDAMPGVGRIGSPSVQLFLSDDALFLFDVTEQILTQESVHEGNMSPPPYVLERPGLQDELLRQARVAGEWLHGQGYRGTASADFLVIERSEKTVVILCEVNARVTGATYPTVLARHFKPDGNWYMRNIGFRKALDGRELLSLMDRANVLYRPGEAKGIIPFNFNTDAEGNIIKGQFVCIGENFNELSGLFIQAWAQLPVEWGYDRD
jgi:hypothetical protein